jgi:hypothetical protein
VVAAITSEDVDNEVTDNFHVQIAAIPVKEAELKQMTRKDKVLDKISHHIQHGWPGTNNDPCLAPYFNRRTLVNDCVLSGERIVIPTPLRQSILHQLHKGHPGMQRMKALARSSVYWPAIDTDIEEFVRQCRPCALTAKCPIKTLLHSWPKAERPWSRVHVDFAGPINGFWYLIIVDAFSKWPEVLQTRSITAHTTIEIMRPIFARFGPPEVLVTDNGTQFTASEFALFCEQLGIIHLRSPAYHPQSNSQAERFVDTLKRGLAKLKRV